MKFEWITDWETIWSESFQSQWLGWMESAQNAHVFFHPAMAKAWVDTYMPLRDIRPLFCIATEGENTIFLPLVQWNKNWKSAFEKAIVPIGYSDFDYHAPLKIGNPDKNKFWKSLISEIKKNKKINFDTFYTDDIFSDLSNNIIDMFNTQECPYIPLFKYESSQEYLASLSKSSRKDLNRSIRQLEGLGKVTYNVLNLEEAIKTLPTLLKFHSQRYTDAYKAPNFHKNLLIYLMPLHLLHVSTLSLNDRIMSWRLGFTCKGVYYSYMPVFDPEYAKFSPSKAHMLFTIEDMIKQKFEIYDLMRGAKAYKNVFTSNSKSVFSYQYQNISLNTAVKKVLLYAKSKIK